jgi:hypothetical protein
MKKLLLSIALLMVATLLFSLGDSIDDDKGVSKDNSVVIVNDVELSS